MLADPPAEVEAVGAEVAAGNVEVSVCAAEALGAGEAVVPELVGCGGVTEVEELEDLVGAFGGGCQFG